MGQAMGFHSGPFTDLVTSPVPYEILVICLNKEKPKEGRAVAHHVFISQVLQCCV
jgi:hypothetical protein